MRVLVGEEKVDPRVYEAALLDEIAERLLEIKKLYEREIPEGAVEPIEKFRITEIRTFIKRPKPWFSATLINDGPDSVFVIVNVEKSFDEHEVLDGETYNVDMRHGLIKDLLIWCNHGEHALIRLVGIR